MSPILQTFSNSSISGFRQRVSNTSLAFAYQTVGDNNVYLKYTVVSQTNSTIAATSQARYSGGSFSSINHFYSMSGRSASASPVATSDRFVYATETRVNQSSTSGAYYFSSGMSFFTTKGYYIGGITSNNTGSVVTFRNQVTYSNDTASSLSNMPIAGGYWNTGMNNSLSAGYITGGYVSGSVYNGILKQNFTNDVCATIGATANNGSQPWSFFQSNDGTAGYMMGFGNAANQIQKLAYSNETVSTLAATSANGGFTASFNVKGANGFWKANGATNGQRISFVNDTTTAITWTVAGGGNEGQQAGGPEGGN